MGTTKSHVLPQMTVDGVDDDPAMDGGIGAVQVIDKLSRTRLPALYES